MRGAPCLARWARLPAHSRLARQMTHEAGSGAAWGESEEGATPAQLVAIEQETPTVKRLTLAVDKSRFAFIPGQWVDFFVPGVPQVGGYSITSTPADLAAAGTFQLAVKRSRYPPSAWLHDQARPGAWVQVHPGGAFHYHPGDEARPLLLLAGGIGITPLASILRHCWQLSRQGADRSTAQQQQQQAAGEQQEAQRAAGGGAAASLRATVLFSASTPQELALLQDLKKLQAESAGAIVLQLRATAPGWRGRDAEWGGRWGRFTAGDIQAAVQELVGSDRAGGGAARQGEGEGAMDQQPITSAAAAAVGSSGGSSSHGAQQQQQQQRSVAEVLAFVCGPPAMLEDTRRHLAAAGLAPDQVRYEQWW